MVELAKLSKCLDAADQGVVNWVHGKPSANITVEGKIHRSALLNDPMPKSTYFSYFE